MSTPEYQKRLITFLEKENEEEKVNNELFGGVDGKQYTRPTETFADRLRLQMAISHTKWQELSREIDVQRPVVLRWLRGQNKPNRTNRQKLIDYFGCDEEDL